MIGISDLVEVFLHKTLTPLGKKLNDGIQKAKQEINNPPQIVETAGEARDEEARDEEARDEEARDEEARDEKARIEEARIKEAPFGPND